MSAARGRDKEMLGSTGDAGEDRIIVAERGRRNMRKLSMLVATALVLAVMLAHAETASAVAIANGKGGERANPNAARGIAKAVANTTKHDRTAEWEALAKSDLRNAATAAVAYAADQPDGSYAGMTLAVLEANYGFMPTRGVATRVFVVADGDGFLVQSEHSLGGGAFQYDSATGEITPIPRF